MESIIIFVLFMAVSAIFQVIKEGAKKQAAPQAKPVKPIARPEVAPHRSPGGQGMTQIKKVQKPVSTAPKYVSAEESMPSPEGSMGSAEGLQTEAYEASQVIEPQRAPEIIEQRSAFQDIQYDDLQRSIVMAEILGKPKALKGNIR